MELVNYGKKSIDHIDKSSRREQFWRNRSTKTMVSNSEFMLLLDQGTMDKEAVEDLFDISAEQLACVNGADPGMGLIRFGDKIVPFDNTMKKDSELYQLFNTNFHEIAGATR